VVLAADVTQGQTSAPGGDEASVRLRPFDFRNPSKMARDHVRRLELTHETFQRAMSTQLSSILRTMVRLELLAVDQVTYDEYVRSMPNPTVIGQMSFKPLPGVVLVEMGTSTALTLVDRLLGGIGKTGLMRRPTELETPLLEDLFGVAAAALQQTFEPIVTVEASLDTMEYNPNFAQAVNASEMVMVLSYSLGILQGQVAEGLMTICYPFSLLDHAWELAPVAEEASQSGAADERERSALEGTVPDLSVPVAVRLRSSAISASDLAALRPGDVLRFDHKVDEPVLGVVGGKSLVEGRLGRKGPVAALEVTKWRTP
jgi:flagellar motor switch protein FliM